MVNEMLYELVDGEEVFRGFCYTHQGRRVIIDGEEGCQHHVCLSLRSLPASDSPYWNITRFKQENAGGWTQNEVEKEVIEAAKKDGREIQRPGTWT